MNNGIEIKITQSDLDRLHAHIYQEVSFEIDWETSQPIRPVVKGDSLLKLYLNPFGLSTEENITVEAPQNGVFVRSKLDSLSVKKVSFESTDELLSCILGMIFEDCYDAIAYIIGKPCGVLKIDPFTHTNQINLNWSGVWMKSNGYFEIGEMLSIKFMYANNVVMITFSTWAELYYDNLRLDTYIEPVPLKKGDNVSLLFDDGTILDFTAKTKPIDGTTFSCTLYKEDIDTFLSRNLVSFRISFSKEGKTPLNGNHYNRIFQIHAEYALQYYLKLFITEVQRLIPNYVPPTRSFRFSIDKYLFNWCYVYLMRDNTNGYHKIGISNKPEYREKTLQSEKPSIEMLACKKYPTRKIAEAIESALHTAYSQQRLRGEWFNLTNADVAAIIETLK